MRPPCCDFELHSASTGFSLVLSIRECGTVMQYTAGLTALQRQPLWVCFSSCKTTFPQVTAASVTTFAEGNPWLEHLDVLVADNGLGGSCMTFHSILAVAANCSGLKVGIRHSALWLFLVQCDYACQGHAVLCSQMQQGLCGCV